MTRLGDTVALDVLPAGTIVLDLRPLCLGGVLVRLRLPDGAEEVRRYAAPVEAS